MAHISKTQNSKHVLMTGVALVLLLLFGLFINRHLSIRALYGDDLYLWSFYYLISHTNEDVFHFLQHIGIGMQMTDSGLLCRQRHIDYLCLQTALQFRLLQFVLGFVQLFLDSRSGLIH